MTLCFRLGKRQRKTDEKQPGKTKEHGEQGSSNLNLPIDPTSILNRDAILNSILNRGQLWHFSSGTVCGGVKNVVTGWDESAFRDPVQPGFQKATPHAGLAKKCFLFVWVKTVKARTAFSTFTFFPTKPCGAEGTAGNLFNLFSFLFLTYLRVPPNGRILGFWFFFRS